MRVEPDEGTLDWTRPGVFEVAPGVYRIPLPLPQDGLRAVNVYALQSVDGALTMVDSGWAITDAREALDKALAALDSRADQVSRFLVTHVHRDHYGMAVAVRREFGTTVSLGEGERGSIEMLSHPDHRPLEVHFDLLRRCGAAELVTAMRVVTSGVKHNSADWSPPDEWLTSGTDLDVSSRTLRVLATPGHTRGHVVFLDQAASLLFAGDHVLPHITPSIGFEGQPVQLPLGDCLHSLRMIRELDDQRLLPAHGPVSPSVHTRVDELLAHHAQRLEDTWLQVGRSGLSAYDVARRLTWTRRKRSFAELNDLFNQMLAVTETAAHLDLLAAQGRLSCAEIDGVRHYDQL